MSRNWVGTGHLKIGDKIKQADGTTGLVANVITVEQTREMFNLTVSEAHTYYVGQDGWLVHNQTRPALPVPAGTNMQTVKHHIFNVFHGTSPQSQKYRDFFKAHGINVDDFTVEMSAEYHKKFIHGAGSNWTTAWKKWIDENPNSTTKEVYQLAGQMMDDYFISSCKIIPY